MLSIAIPGTVIGLGYVGLPIALEFAKKTKVVGFDINDSANVYGKVVSGFKSGGTSQRSSNEELFKNGFEEEDILSYEVGYKGDFWGRRARLNVAAFYILKFI